MRAHCRRWTAGAALAALWLAMLLAVALVHVQPGTRYRDNATCASGGGNDTPACRSNHTWPSSDIMNRTWLSLPAMARPRVFDTLQQWPPPAVIYVRSAPKETALRQAIRDTWAADAWKHGIPVLIFTGWSVANGVNESLSAEESQHDDLFICDFIDHYHMLSVKMLYVLRWHIVHSRTSALVSVNSDAIIYPKSLAAYVHSRRLSLAADVDAFDATVPAPIYGECTCTGACKQLKGPPVWRKVGSKFYLPPSVYKGRRLPHHCIGYATVMSSAAAQLVAVSAARANRTFLEAFWIDDVLYSGIFAAEWPSITLHRDRSAFKTQPHFYCARCIAQHWFGLTEAALRRVWKHA